MSLKIKRYDLFNFSSKNEKEEAEKYYDLAFFAYM